MQTMKLEKKSFEMMGYGGKYEPIRLNLTDDEIREAHFRITTSERFEFGELGHLVLSGTETIIGYLGSSTLELCCPEEAEPQLYRIPHKHLRRIFSGLGIKVKNFYGLVN